jgi:transposase
MFQHAIYISTWQKNISLSSFIRDYLKLTHFYVSFSVVRQYMKTVLTNIYMLISWRLVAINPCGGGVEYLHRDPASRRRRRKGKSQIWDSKIWSWVPRDSDPTKTALAGARSIYKRQTRPLVREGAPQKQDRDCQKIINIWSRARDGARYQDLLTDWPSVAMWLWLWLGSNS